MRRRRSFLAVILVFAAACAYGADSAREATMMPQTVYVGDRARLFVQLETVLGGASRASVAIDRAELLPHSPAVDVHRVEIERRPNGDRAVIDFTAFEPGTVTLPVIEAGGVRLEGLRVSVASSLESGESVLSPPADPLAVPGTFLLLYGGLFMLLVLGAGVYFFLSRVVPWYAGYRDARRRGLAARSLRKVLDRLSSQTEEMLPGDFLCALFDALRGYLSSRTGVNCRSLTAGEYRNALAVSEGPSPLTPEDLSFLETLFRRGDAVRFGSSPSTGAELKGIIGSVSLLLERLEASPC